MFSLLNKENRHSSFTVVTPCVTSHAVYLCLKQRWAPLVTAPARQRRDYLRCAPSLSPEHAKPAVLPSLASGYHAVDPKSFAVIPATRPLCASILLRSFGIALRRLMVAGYGRGFGTTADTASLERWGRWSRPIGCHGQSTTGRYRRGSTYCIDVIFGLASIRHICFSERPKITLTTRWQRVVRHWERNMGCRNCLPQMFSRFDCCVRRASACAPCHETSEFQRPIYTGL